jgi:hypothetical protein
VIPTFYPSNPEANIPYWTRREGQDTSTTQPEELTSQTLVAIANIHVIDQGIHDIAKEFRFTVEEVQEYYDKCGEMGRTRARFQKMRQELQSRFMDDDR